MTELILPCNIITVDMILYILCVGGKKKTMFCMDIAQQWIGFTYAELFPFESLPC